MQPSNAEMIARHNAGQGADVAHTILLQLGGGKFLAMTGAKPAADGNTLRVKLPRGAKDGINLVSITLQDDDTYSMVFAKFRGLDVKNLRTLDMVYADGLAQAFEIATGLRVSL